jgi:hypothetical protein
VDVLDAELAAARIPLHRDIRTGPTALVGFAFSGRKPAPDARSSSELTFSATRKSLFLNTFLAQIATFEMSPKCLISLIFSYKFV